MKNGKSNNVYNVCTGIPFTTKEIVKIFNQLTKKPIKVLQDKKRFGDHEISISYGNNNKIKNQTSWFPKINLYNSINDSLEYSDII